VRAAIIIDTGAQGSAGNPELERRLRRAREFGASHFIDIIGIERTSEVRIARSLEINHVPCRTCP